MQVTRATFIPLLAAGNADRIDPSAVREEFIGDLTVVYTFGPQFGRRVVTHADLDQMEMPGHALRRSALEHLEVLAGRAEFHGQPPALMLSFEGLESSLLLATDFWTRLQGSVPGDLVVGVPARDVVVVTGSQSPAGLEKARRCVERVFFAGDEHLLSRKLLVRRGGAWELFDRPAARQAPRPHGPARHRGPDQLPRQFQEHPSWPGERVPVARPAGPAERMPGVPVGPGPLGPVPLAPAAGGRPPMGLPHQTGPLAPVAQHGTPPRGPAFPPAPMTSTSTGGLPPVSPADMAAYPVHRPAAPVRDDFASRPADIAQFSAVPYSAVPYSAMPYSAMPYSAAPYSGAPYSAVPNSAQPYSAPPSAYLHSRGARPQGKPPYRDDAYSTGARPLYSAEYRPEPEPRREPTGAHEPVSYRDAVPTREPYRDPPGYDPDPRPAESYPAYPESWGTAPRPARPEWRTGPRARFSR